MEAMHKDSCACAKSELDLFYVSHAQVEMEKGFCEDIDPITSIAASDTIEFLCAANSGVYTDLASSYLHVKAKITVTDGANWMLAYKWDLLISGYMHCSHKWKCS